MPESNQHIREVYFDQRQGWSTPKEFQKAIRIGDNKEFSEQMIYDPDLSEIDSQNIVGKGFEIGDTLYTVHSRFREQLKEAFLCYADLPRYNIAKNQDGELIDDQGRTSKEDGYNHVHVDALIALNALRWLQAIIESSKKD